MEEEIKRIAKVMLKSERVCVQDLRNMLAGYTEQEIGLTIWRARQMVRVESGIDFVAKPSGYLSRATPIETSNSAMRQQRAGVRKIFRGADRLKLAASLTTDEKDRHALERRADRVAERAELAQLRHRAKV